MINDNVLWFDITMHNSGKIENYIEEKLIIIYFTHKNDSSLKPKINVLFL